MVIGWAPAANPYKDGIYASGILESDQTSGANINVCPEVPGTVKEVLVTDRLRILGPAAQGSDNRRQRFIRRSTAEETAATAADRALHITVLRRGCRAAALSAPAAVCIIRCLPVTFCEVSAMPKFAANLSMLFTELDFLARFAAAARCGFTAVEYLFPYAYPKEQLAETLRKHNLTQVLHNLPAGNWDAGDRGIACHADRVSEFQEGVDRAVDYARTLGCKQINCLAGIAPESISSARTREVFVGNLKYAAPRLAAQGIKLLIEPINTFDLPGFFLSRTSQALEIMAEAAEPNLYLQYDVYHMQMMEGNLATTIKQNLARIAHIQAADVPGRHEPGTGEINYPFLFQHLDSIGYQGWVGCEYKPLAKTEDGLGWLAASEHAAA